MNLQHQELKTPLEPSLLTSAPRPPASALSPGSSSMRPGSTTSISSHLSRRLSASFHNNHPRPTDPSHTLSPGGGRDHSLNQHNQYQRRGSQSSMKSGGGGGGGSMRRIKSGRIRSADTSPAATAITTTQADMHRRAQAIHYPGYHQDRVHSLPSQNEKKIDHLYIVDLVINMNKESLIRFGVRKEMKHLLHKRSMQKFLLDTFWWFFLDSFSSVNFDGMVSRAQGNHLVSDAEMRAYVKSGVAVDAAKVAKSELKKDWKQQQGGQRGGMTFSSSSDSEDGRDDDDDDGQALVAAHLQPAKRPAQHYLKNEDENSTDGEDGKKGGEVGKKNNRKKKKGSKKDQKLTLEDYAPPSHLNSLKPKNRHAEDVAQIGSPSYPTIDALYAVVRANSELSEWSDSDTSTTSFIQPNFDVGPIAPGSAGERPGEGTLDLLPRQQGNQGLTTGTPRTTETATPGRSAAGSLATPQLGFLENNATNHSQQQGGLAIGEASPGFAETTRPRVRTVASSLLQVKKFLPMTYALHKLDPAARASVVAGQQHQLFTRMANNYGSTIQKLSRRLHHTLKDGLTRLLPDILAQILLVCFNRAIPFAMELFDDEFQVHLWSTLSFWTGGVHRHGNTRAWPIHVLVDPVLAQKAELRVMNAALQEAQLSKALSRRGSHFSIGSGSSKQTAQSKPVPPRELSLVPACATRTPRPPRAPSGSNFAVSARTQSEGASGAKFKASSPLSIPDAGLSAGEMLPGLGAPKRSIVTDHRKPPPDSPGRERDRADSGTHQPSGKASSNDLNSSTRLSGAKGRVKSKLSLVNAVKGPKFDAVGAFLAPNSRAQWMVNRDVELMKTELHRLRTTHTFSQSHYAPGAKEPTTTTPRSPTPAGKVVRSTSPAKGTNAGTGKKSVPNAGGGDDAGHDGIVKRTMYTYNIQTQKRTVQVIKQELDAKYKDYAPWYGSSKDRVPIKEQLGATKFSVKNWSPLVHRFMLQAGRDNGLPSEGMTWTL